VAGLRLCWFVFGVIYAMGICCAFIFVYKGGVDVVGLAGGY